MTLNIAAQGTDFVVLGSDSRGVFGDYRMVTATIDTMIKQSQVSEHVMVQTSGVAEIGDAMVDEFKALQSDKKTDGVSAVLNEFRNFVQSKWNDYFRNVPFQNQPPILFTVAGLDISNGVFTSPRIYSIMSQLGFAPNLHRYGYACTGIPQYAIYIFNRRYSPNVSREQLVELVVYAIAETETQEQRVGGPIKVSTITKDGAKDLSQDEVNGILKKLRGA